MSRNQMIDQGRTGDPERERGEAVGKAKRSQGGIAG